MRKNVKNDKVLRAITIGLATMIAATSAPVTAFAEEAEGAEGSANSAPAVSSSSEESSNTECSGSSPSENTSSEASSAAAECIDIANNDIPPAAEAVADASEAVAAITDVIDPADATVIEGIQEGLTEVAGDLETVGGEDGNLDTAASAIAQALLNDANAEAALEEGNKKVTEAGEKIKAFNNAKPTTESKAGEAIDQADVANTSNDQREAEKAAADAVEALRISKEGLEAATDAYNAADKAVSAVDDKLKKAVEEQEAAAKRLDDAKNALNDASINATAANERLKGIQAQMDALDKKVDDLAKSKETLEKLSNQYYKLMVHFYRDSNIASAVYKDGKLDVEKSAQKLSESGKETTKLTENTYRVGRELMRQLINYKLEANGVDPSTIHIGDEVTKNQKFFDEGTLTKDNNNLDKVSVVDEKKLSPEDRAEWEKEHSIYFSAYGQGLNGTANSVKVTYTVKDENGNDTTVTEYYNYEIKGRGENDELDFENGPIYLALIDGKNVERDTGVNNMDDLRNLNQRMEDAMKAAQLLDEYNAAKKAVDDAQALVDDIASAIETLSETELKVSDEKVKALEEALELAKGELETAKEEKEALEGKVDDAQKAVDSIDLSRFNKKPAKDDEDTDPEPEPAPAPAPIVVTPTDIIPEPGDAPIAPIVPSTSAFIGGGSRESGVAGVRVEDPAAETVRPIASINPVFKKADLRKNNGKLVKIENNEIPLAAMPTEEGLSMNWWWLLVIALLGATGKAMYENHKKKVEARARQNIDR